MIRAKNLTIAKRLSLLFLLTLLISRIVLPQYPAFAQTTTGSGLFSSLVEQSYCYNYLTDGNVLFALYDMDFNLTEEYTSRPVKAIVCLDRQGAQLWRYDFPYYVLAGRMVMAQLTDGSYAILAQMADRESFRIVFISAQGKFMAEWIFSETGAQPIITPIGIYYDSKDIDGTGAQLAFMNWEKQTTKQALRGVKSISLINARTKGTHTLLEGYYRDMGDTLLTTMVVLDKAGNLQYRHDLGTFGTQWLINWTSNQKNEVVAIVQESQNGKDIWHMRGFSDEGLMVWETEISHGDYFVSFDEMKQTSDGNYHLWGSLSKVQDPQVKAVLYELVLDQDRHFVSNTFKPFSGYLSEYVDGAIYATVFDSVTTSYVAPFDGLQCTDMAGFTIKNN